MRNKAITVLGVFVIICVLICGCSSNTSSGSLSERSSSVTTRPPITDSVINQDFASFALSINDLPKGWRTLETPKITQNSYESKFVYLGGSTGVPLNFKIKRFESVDSAKRDFTSNEAAIISVRVDPIDVGKEGFAYEKMPNTVLVFRNGNLIISIDTYAAPAIPIDDLIPYAAIVNSRIES